MKKALLLAIITLLALPGLFAGSLALGAVASYEPSNCNLFDFSQFSYADDFFYGATFEFRGQKALSITEDIHFYNLNEGELDIESVTYFSFRKNFSNGLALETGVGFEISLQNAVEGSDRLYITSNGISISHLGDLVVLQLLEVLGMFRPRFSLSKDLFEHLRLRLDYVMDWYPAAKLLPEGTVLEFLGMGKISLAALYVF